MSGVMKIVFWDVQHGNATYIKSQNDRHIIIDLGTGDYSGNNQLFSPLQNLKQNFGVKQLDYCIITHPHKDHIDDIMNFSDLNPKVLLKPGHIPEARLRDGVRTSDLPIIEKYIKISNQYNLDIEKTDYNYPRNPDNFGGMQLSTFTPKKCSLNNLNNQSIVTVVEYANSKVVIPGDNERASWNELLESHSFIQRISNADVFLASHHGRESGYCDEIMDLIKPKITVISDGSYHDNSVREKYANKSSGWIVHKDGEKTKRKTLSTYNDGEIFLSVGFNDDGGCFLQVNV